MGTSDGYYIERCLDGHPDDFRHLVRRYQSVLLAHLAGRLGSTERAEDAAQDRFFPGCSESQTELQRNNKGANNGGLK